MRGVLIWRRTGGPSAVTPDPEGERIGKLLGMFDFDLWGRTGYIYCLVVLFVVLRRMAFIGDALAAATSRGVSFEILLPTRSTHADDALDELDATIRRDGAIGNFRVSRLRFDAPWVHLKVLTSDSLAAYIGSANVTGAGIAGHNLELGVLVRGATVSVVESILELYREQ